MAQRNLLIVDDEPDLRFALRAFLEPAGYEVREAGDLRSCRATLHDWRPDAIVLDFKLPDGTALDLVTFVKGFDPTIAIVVLTGYGSIELAVQAIKDGADHFLTKPVELSVLETVLEKSISLQRLTRSDQVEKLRQPYRGRSPFIGKGPAVRRLQEQAERVLGSESPVLLQGETGSGKGVLAEWLHRSGSRADGAFVDLNCAGLTREFLETELFGHERGAFTGAVTAKQGLLELAHGGTLFLDEIGDMDLLVQAKILKVVEEKRFRRVGDVRDRIVDLRLIAASHLDLQTLVGERRFRNDLYYRISTLPIALPALRERTEDIPELAAHLVALAAREVGRPGAVLTPKAIRALQRYRWPGNIRELRNVLERAVLVADDQTIDERHLAFSLDPRPNASRDASELTLEQMERRHIQQVLEQVGGKVDLAAVRLAIPRSSLYQKLKKFGLSGRNAS